MWNLTLTYGFILNYKNKMICPSTDEWIKKMWEMGGGIGMGNTCKPMAVSFQFMTKFTTNKKNKIKKLKN